MSRIVKHLEAKLDEPNSYYADIWVVHYQEDILSRTFDSWVCKAYKEVSECQIKDDTDFEKIFKTYDGMLSVGRDSALVKAKGPDAVMKQIKALTLERVPSGDQLNELRKCDIIRTLKEFTEYAYETPEICLEKEMQWPDEAELNY